MSGAPQYHSPFRPDPSRPLRFLAHCRAYVATPLRRLPLGPFGTLLIKDESARMGSGSFKALGGVYAVASLILERWGNRIGSEPPIHALYEEPTRRMAGELTFVCASAGNHGMAVATGATHFGARSRIHLAGTVSPLIAARLRKAGAEVVRSGETYEDSVEAALRDAQASGAILLADTSSDPGDATPGIVMEGYTVMSAELRVALDEGGTWPTHVFLQAGVGGLAAAMAWMIRHSWLVQPRIVVVEPDAAGCLMESARRGIATRVEGPVSNMGRLDCKEPSLLAFETLRTLDVEFRLVSDAAAAAAARLLRQQGLATTPSGAAGFAGALEYFHGGGAAAAVPLVFVTEGER